MPPQGQTLAQSVRAKFPHVYDDLNDTDLEAKILAKYPEYSDMPRTQDDAPALAARAAEQAKNQAFQSTVRSMASDLSTVGSLKVDPATGTVPGTDIRGGVHYNTPIDPNDAVLRTGTLPQKIHRAIGNVAENIAPVAAPYGAVAPMSLATSVLGGGVGSAVGKTVGDVFLSPYWSDVAGDVGGIAGSIYGAQGGARLSESADKAGGYNNLIASKLRNPATARQSMIGRPGSVKPILPASLQRYTIPDWAIPTGDVGTPTNPGPFREFWNRNSAYSPPESVSGVPQSSVPGVMVIPEPRPEFEGENTGYMASVKRGKLAPMAVAGKPGAGTQLQNLGSTVLYAPPSSYGTPRSVTNFSDVFDPPAEAPSDVPVYSANPFDPRLPKGGANGGGTSTLGLVEGEAPMVNAAQQLQSHSGEIARLESVLRNPMATPEERAYAMKAMQATQTLRGIR